MENKIPIKSAKFISENYDMSHVVIFSVDENGNQHVVTYGKTIKNSEEAAAAGNSLKRSLNWPENLCNSKPVERICGNCDYFKRDFGYHFFNGWSKDGSDGHCHLEPKKIFKEVDSIACKYLSIKYTAY